MQLRNVKLLCIHFKSDSFCGIDSYPEWHLEFQQGMYFKDANPNAAAAPWGGPPISNGFRSILLDGGHAGGVTSEIVQGNMGHPLVVAIEPRLAAWWETFWHDA